jgi:phage tail-like protein
MARTGTLDPLTRYRFLVYVQGPDLNWNKAGFQSVTPPRIDIKTNEYPEGGRHLNPHILTEGAQFSTITMQRGKTFSADFYMWFSQVWRAFYGDRQGASTNYRATVYIDHLDREGKVVKKYILSAARPVAYIAASGFDAEDDSAPSIELITIAYEGYEEYSVDSSRLASIIGGAAANLLNRALGTSVSSLQPGPNRPNTSNLGVF